MKAPNQNGFYNLSVDKGLPGWMNHGIPALPGWVALPPLPGENGVFVLVVYNHITIWHNVFTQKAPAVHSPGGVVPPPPAADGIYTLAVWNGVGAWLNPFTYTPAPQPPASTLPGINNRKVAIFGFAGQSNCASANKTYSSDPTPVQNAWMFSFGLSPAILTPFDAKLNYDPKTAGSIIPLQDPVQSGFNLSPNNPAYIGYIYNANSCGFIVPFIKKIQQDPRYADVDIIVYCGAMGGSNISPTPHCSYFWDPLSTQHTLAQSYLEGLNKLLKQYPGAEVEGLLWHQGESLVVDATKNEVATYGNWLKTFYAWLCMNIRQRNKNIPMICGTPVGYSKPLEDQFKVFAASHWLCAYSPMWGMSTEADMIHFDKPAMEQAGNNMADLFLQLKNKL